MMHVLVLSEAKSLGAKHYFTGVPCARGHFSVRVVSTRSCMECNRVRSRVEMQKKRADAETRAAMAAQWRAWYHDGNQKKRIENSNEWRDANREKYRINMRRATRKFRASKEGKAYSFAVKCISRCLANKTDRTFCLLGYRREDLIRRIESMFSDWMSWSNHGDWHIDHIKPVSLFLKEGIRDPKVINALQNLQPLWASENIKKGAKVPKE